jgi:hypothetical protein
MASTARRRTALAVLAVAGAGYAGLGRRWQLYWGATGEEARDVLPGDDLMPVPDLVATRAVSVHAPASTVWPWLAQLGQGRGGLYSHDGLENLFGLDIHSADRVVSEWQQVVVGDEVRLAEGVGLRVVLVDPGRALVVRGGVPAAPAGPPYEFTWAWVLRERPDGTTRLVVRERYNYTRWWAPLLVEPVSVVSWFMTRAMLHGIRDRAETVGTAAAATVSTGPGVPRPPRMPGSPAPRPLVDPDEPGRRARTTRRSGGRHA